MSHFSSFGLEHRREIHTGVKPIHVMCMDDKLLIRKGKVAVLLKPIHPYKIPKTPTPNTLSHEEKKKNLDLMYGCMDIYVFSSFLYINQQLRIHTKFCMGTHGRMGEQA